MSISINPVTVNPVTSATTPKVSSAINQVSESFGKVLDSLNQSQETSDNLLAQMSAGENVDIHTVMIATEENDVNFKVAMAIRDRLVDAYREVMRMSI